MLRFICCVALDKSPNLSELLFHHLLPGWYEQSRHCPYFRLFSYLSLGRGSDLPAAPHPPKLDVSLQMKSFDIISASKEIGNLSWHLALSAKRRGSSGYRKQVETTVPGLNVELIWEAVRNSGT